MTRDDRTALLAANPPPPARRKPGALKTLWRNVRQPLARSRLAISAVTTGLYWTMRFIERTNPLLAGSDDPATTVAANTPAIFTLWHGQHIMSVAVNHAGAPVVTMFSRSADAELNARVAERFGLEVVRGSGGRDRARTVDKGGARALIALKKALDQGKSVCMIADIPHGTPRDSGLGVVTLARISGRPIIPVAYATSRRKVLEKSWDKTTINLPFGRAAIRFGEPIHVPPDAGDADMERCRLAVNAGLDAVTRDAYALVDRAA